MLAGSFLPPLGAMAEEPAAPEGFERWTPYVSSGKIWEDVSNITATESDWAGAFENTHENGFTDNEGMIGHGWNGNNSGMIYSKERYTDFEMTFDYRSPDWDNIYIGIGASKQGSTFSNQDTGLYSLLIGCKGNVNLRNKTGSTDNWISGDLYNQDPELANFKKLKHSMRIRVVNKKITVYIRESEDGDWNERGTADLAEYNGGYIYLASYTWGGRFAAPVVEKKEVAPAGFENWTPYYASVEGSIWDHIKEITPETSDWAGAFEQHENSFTDNEGMINHKFTGNDCGMIYSKESYTDFEMTFDYRSPDWDNIYIGIGASMPGNTFSNQDTGLYLLTLGCKGHVNLTNKTGSIDNWISGDVYSQDPELANFRKLKHAMKIRVVNKKITVYIRESEDGGWNERGTVDLQEYNGGYIYLTSYTQGGRFAAPAVKDMGVSAAFADFTPYNVDCGDGFFGGTNSVKMDNYDSWVIWPEIENQESLMTSYPWQGGTKAGYMFSNETYENFELTMQYYVTTSWNKFWLGIGSPEQGKTPTESDGNGMTVFQFNSYGVVEARTDGTVKNENGSWTYTDDTQYEIHTVKLVVNKGHATVYLLNPTQPDQEPKRLEFDLGENYKGGYIYLKSWAPEARFSAPKIESLNNELPRFSSYYSKNITYGSEAAVDLTEADPLQYWTEKNGKITRKDVPAEGDVCDDLYMAELFLKEQTYKDFELNVDVKRGTSGWSRAFVGFGAELGRHFQQSGGGTTVYLDHDDLRYGGWDELNDRYKEGDWGLKYSEIGETDTFHLRIVVQDGSASVYVNDYEKPSTFELSQGYQGGYIYLASNSTGTEFSNLTVEELESKGNNFDAYAGYHSNNITYGSADAVDLTEVDPAEYWRELDGTITRRKVQPKNDEEAGQVCDDLYMAELFLKEQKYENFELNVDVKRGTDGWRRAFVGFGAQLGRHFQQSGGGTTVYLDNTFLRYGGWDELNGEYREGDWGLEYSGIGENDTFHLRIVVQDMEATVYVGDSDKPTSFGLQGSYQGGYIFLASNSTGTVFSNLTVKELPNSGTDSAFDRFVCYYSDHIAFGSENAQNLQETKPKNFWRAEDGKIIRKKTQNGDIRDYGLMAELFLKERTYENFELNVDITRGTNGWQRAFVGFGAQMGRHFQQSGGGTMVYLDHEFLRYGGWDDENSTYKEGDWGLTCDGIGDDDTFHLRLLVMGGVAYVYVNDSAEPTKFAISENYRGGYIYLASNASDTTYANLTVEEIPEGVFNNFSDFSSYYTERVSGEALVSADPAQYWTELNGVITRKKQNMGENQEHGSWDECSYHLDKMAYLFLNGAYTEHENYQIELDYRGGTGAWARTYMGFGAGKTSTWREKDGGTVFFADGSGYTIFEGNLYRNGTIEKNVGGKQLKNYKDGERHHMKLVCRGGIYTIYVDDVEVKTLVVNKYNQGGRFFLATNSSGTEFSNIKVTILPDDSTGFGGYDEWYSPNISTTPLTDVKEGTNWSIVDGVITRKAIDLDAQEVKESKVYDVDVAYLYLTDKTYTNFKVELDYKHGNTGWRRSPIGFGAEIGKSFLDEDGGITCFSQPDGIVQITGNIRFNGTFGESVTWATYDENGKDISTIKPYDSEEWHHMVMEVEGGYVTVIIDGFSYHYELSLPGHYKGGYLYLTSNSAASQYRNITIEDYSERDQEDSGWSPKQEDTEFDFGWRKKEDTDSIWKWLYKKITWRKN